MLLERMVESDRIITFRVAWIDDKGASSKQRISHTNEFRYRTI
jgi:glutamate dehydrogenase (NADP+)